MMVARTRIALRRSFSHCFAWLLVASCFFAVAQSAKASLPTDPAERAKVVGQPVALVVQPSVVQITGPRGLQQVVVTGKYADGSVRDLTPFCEMSLEKSEALEVGPGGLLKTKLDGELFLVVKVGGQSAKAPVKVAEMDKAK